MGEAKKMIAAAAEAGADCVKLQKSSLKVSFFQLLAKCWNDFILPQEKFNSAALARTYSGPHSWGSTYGEHKQHSVGVVFWHFKKFSFNHTVPCISISKVFISINRIVYSQELSEDDYKELQTYAE